VIVMLIVMVVYAEIISLSSTAIPEVACMTRRTFATFPLNVSEPRPKLASGFQLSTRLQGRT
jgi:hypothetical protein